MCFGCAVPRVRQLAKKSVDVGSAGGEKASPKADCPQSQTDLCSWHTAAYLSGPFCLQSHYSYAARER